MSEPHLDTTLLHGWLERIRAGDLTARDELLRRIGGRLEHLARKMLKRFPNVRLWAETDDVLQNAVMRLLRTLEKVEPASVGQFFGLAALHIRRELLDLARHFAAHHRARPAGSLPGDDRQVTGFTPTAPDEATEDLERWRRFHEEVEKLPPEQREVVGLIFYHGWKQKEVANIFEIDERTVRRRWEAAMVALHHILAER